MSSLALNDLATVSQLKRDLLLGLKLDFLFEPSAAAAAGWTVSAVYQGGRQALSLSATNNAGVREFKTLDAAVRQVQSICGLNSRPSLMFEAPLSRELSDAGFAARQASLCPTCGR